MIIGILALQGAFIEHKDILDKMNIPCIFIKKSDHIKLCDGIIIPGGESTVISILDKNIFDEIKLFITPFYISNADYIFRVQTNIKTSLL